MANPVVIDGKSYSTVNINGQIWMAENLAYTGNGKDYNNDVNNREIYGRLYNYTEAMANAPTGWHLPSDDEWITLLTYVDSTYIILVNDVSIENTLKLKSNTLWITPGNNALGFNAKPAGYFGFGSFSDLGIRTMFNSSTPTSEGQGHWLLIKGINDEGLTDRAGVTISIPESTILYTSVRYIKDGSSLTSVSPTSGTSWNHTVILSGTGLSTANIYFDGTLITDYVSRSDTSASILVPIKPHGDYSFTIG